MKDLIKSKDKKFNRMSIKMEKEKIVEIISENQKIKETIQIDDSTSKKQEKNQNNSNKNKVDDSNKSQDDDSNKNKDDDSNKDINYDDVLYPFDEMMDLNPDCQNLVKEAVSNNKKKFIVGKSLIEGKLGFLLNSQLGIRYLQESRTKDSMIYLSKLYVEGEIIPEDINEAKIILIRIERKEEEATYLYLLGRISKKEKNYAKAFEYFEKSSKFGNPDSMFYCGKMLQKGYEGVDQNKDTSNATSSIFPTRQTKKHWRNGGSIENLFL